jgi:hypothetical protein
MDALDLLATAAKLDMQIQADQGKDQPDRLVGGARGLCAIRVNDVLVHELFT